MASYQNLLLLLDEKTREFTAQEHEHGHRRLTEILIADMTFVDWIIKLSGKLGRLVR